MDSKQIQLALGGFYHDIGKLLYLYNDDRNHCISGYEFLKELGITDEGILEQVRYHHSSEIRKAYLKDDSLAYVTYWANKVAAADRKSKEEKVTKYDKCVYLESVFNALNGNREINYSTYTPEGYNESIYEKIIDNIREGISKTELTTEYVNSIIGILEANLSFVSSSSNVDQLADISLFDHMKITAAIGSCIYQYLSEEGVTNFKGALLDNSVKYYEKNSFLMFGMDISGIQNFIYSVGSEGTLKMLRSKSFYLEIMLEHIIDELLDVIGVSRANLIYSGGGHAYILLPNTKETKDKIEWFDKKTREWFLSNFGIELYVAMGFVACSANNLMNEPDESCSKVFKAVSKEVSNRKVSRYTVDEIRKLNEADSEEHTRECRACGRTDRLNDDDLCEFCDSFRNVSDDMLSKKYIIISSNQRDAENGIRLPFDRYMILENEEELRSRIKDGKDHVRLYSKNKLLSGMNISTRLWAGDYIYDSSFEALAESSKGIKRLGVLHADVDDFEQAFLNGFSGQYVSISRAASFSRKMSMFFKLSINSILSNGSYYIDESESSERRVAVIYSGGDDVFLIGAWNDVIEAGVDISDALSEYSQGTLTVSAGVGLFPGKYPVKALARQTAELEDVSKNIDGNNAITLFDSSEGEHTYKWDVFKSQVIGEKYRLIDDYFTKMEDKGMSAMYRLMEYIRHIEDDRINLARLAYMLGRMEPDSKAPEEVQKQYGKFSKKLYGWISSDNSEENRKQLVTAIFLYVYLHRE